MKKGVTQLIELISTLGFLRVLILANYQKDKLETVDLDVAVDRLLANSDFVLPWERSLVLLGDCLAGTQLNRQDQIKLLLAMLRNMI